MTIKEKIIDNIKGRIDIMANTCSSIRTLNDCIAAYGDSLVIVLRLLTASWDQDKRPVLSNGNIINYIDFKGYILIDSKNTSFKLEELTNEDIKSVNSYLEIMIPKKSSESMMGYYPELITE